MIFASTPTTGAPPRRPGRYLAAGVGWGRAHQPNPILLEVRESAERARTNNVDLSARADMWLVSLDNLAVFGGFTSWDSPGHPRHVLTTASEAEIDHARRVLTRLVRRPAERRCSEPRCESFPDATWDRCVEHQAAHESSG